MRSIEQQLTNDISKNFNTELETNIKNALFNLDINFDYQHDFYTFVRNRIIRIELRNNYYELRIDSGEYLLTYSLEPQFNMDNLEHGKISATAGIIEIVKRKTTK